MNTDNLEKREFIISENDKVFGDLSLISIIAFDEEPAIGQNFQLFSNNKYIFAQTSEEKKLLIGPAMRPNIEMLRQDQKTGQYFMGFFSEDQVRVASQVFLKGNNHNGTNINHGIIAGKNEIAGVNVVESWIVEDPNNDKANALGFKELQKGDWYVAMKIEDDAFWNFLKEHGKGFSIEGVFATKLMEKFSTLTEEQIIKDIVFSNEMSDSDKEEKIKEIIFNTKSE